MKSANMNTFSCQRLACQRSETFLQISAKHGIFSPVILTVLKLVLTPLSLLALSRSLSGCACVSRSIMKSAVWRVTEGWLVMED